MVIGSMCFVGLYIGYHTGSLFLALLGLLQILLSLPLALFFYVVLRVTWFSQAPPHARACSCACAGACACGPS